MVGLIGKKRGMTQVFTAAGELVPVTVVETGPCTVVQAKTPASDGYAAVQLGFGQRKPQRVSKALREHCLKAEKGVFRVLREFRPGADQEFSVGQELRVADVFKVGDRIDVAGTAQGRGLTGLPKGHNLGGFPGSHGKYGNERVTMQNLEVVEVRAEDNLLFIRGAIPGANGGLVTVVPAIKGGHA